MSLRAKLMVAIFISMVLVLGLLAMNLWLDATVRVRAEASGNAQMIARWVRDSMPRTEAWTDDDWKGLSERLARSKLISEWTGVGYAGTKKEALKVIFSNEPDAAEKGEKDGYFWGALASPQAQAVGNRVYVTLETVSGEPFAVRLGLRETALPAYDVGSAMKGILTAMSLGTAILLLNAYILVNRLVLRPLETLVEASGRVAAGDFSKKIPEAKTYDEMGRMMRAFNLMIDKIGEHHRTLEEEIRKARSRIRETERRLSAAQRLSTTGTLAAGIAHEINNPLGGMINAAQALNEGRLDAVKQREYLGLIADGLDRVRAIVQKILQFQPRPFQPQPVNLKETVDRAIAFLHHRAQAKGVTLRNDLPADLFPVNGDPLELQQAFLNVLMNAVDACVMGEGRVTVSHREAGERARVAVADNGCGMEEEELARCMDPFFTTKDVGEGTGLGLAVAHNIVTNHGGRIEVESRRGGGTTVTLTLPFLKEAPTTSRIQRQKDG